MDVRIVKYTDNAFGGQSKKKTKVQQQSSKKFIRYVEVDTEPKSRIQIETLERMIVLKVSATFTDLNLLRKCRIATQCQNLCVFL